MVSDRLTKEELKEDRVLAAATQAVEYARRNARWVLAAVIVLAAAIVLAVVLTQSRVSRERQAAAILLRGQSLYVSASYAEAANEFSSLVARFGGTPSGRLGRLYLGNAQLAVGNPGAAEEAFRKFLSGGKPDPLSESAARRGLGAAYVAQGKPAEGAAEYVKAAGIEGNGFAGEDWLQAALAWLAAGNREQSIRALQQVIERAPRSQAASEARVRLEELRTP